MPLSSTPRVTTAVRIHGGLLLVRMITKRSNLPIILIFLEVCPLRQLPALGLNQSRLLPSQRTRIISTISMTKKGKFISQKQLRSTIEILSNFFKLAKLKCKQKIHCFKIQKVKSRWIKEVVARGDGYGKKICFPTLNLNTGQVDGKIKEGIYACITCYDKQIYPSVLFYGPRLIKGESHNVLEIYVIDF